MKRWRGPADEWFKTSLSGPTRSFCFGFYFCFSELWLYVLDHSFCMCFAMYLDVPPPRVLARARGGVSTGEVTCRRDRPRQDS